MRQHAVLLLRDCVGYKTGVCRQKEGQNDWAGCCGSLDKGSYSLPAGNGSVRRKGKGRGKNSGRGSEPDGGIPSAGAAALSASGGALIAFPLSEVNA